MLNVNLSFGKVFGVGYGTSEQLILMTRGQDAGGLYGSWGYNARMGKDTGFSLTFGGGSYTGNRRNATFNSLMGLGADLAFGQNGLITGGWVSFSDDCTISWYGSNWGVGFFSLELGGKTGFSAGFGTATGGRVHKIFNMLRDNNIKFALFILLTLVLFFFFFFVNRNAKRRIYDYEFSGVVHSVSYNVKGFPRLTVNGNEYHFSIGYNFKYAIQKGDTIDKAAGTYIIILKKRNSGKRILFDM